MPQLRVTELEFEQIKNNLKTFMKSQSEFSDYDFDGAGLNVLLDVLSYNTHYNAVLSHMLANESFLDSAVKRSSVVSIAKAIGYQPVSVTGSLAYVNITITPSASYVSNSLSINKNTVFNSSSIKGSVPFVVDGTFTTTRNSSGNFVFENVKLKQGTRVTNTFLVEENSLQGPFTIPNENADTSTIVVKVQNSKTDLTLTTFSPYSNIIDVTSESNVFYINEEFDGLYSLRFGDGVIGKKLTAGNLLVVEYLVSKGADGNSLSTFSSKSSITGSGETVAVNFVTKSQGGSGKESIDSVRYNAPLFNATKGRVVTSTDYETLIKQSYGNIQSVTVWGGENNNPPIYGKVFMSAQPVAGAIITEAQKQEIINNIILPKSPVSVIPEFVDPSYDYIHLDCKVTYNSQKTFLTPFDIETAAKGAIETYFNTELNQLGKDFYFTKAHDFIKNVSNSVISVSIDPSLQKRVLPEFNKDNKYTINYNTKLHPRDMSSTFFDIKFGDTTQKVSLCDVPRVGVEPPEYDGIGDIHAKSSLGVKIAKIGTVNYSTGEVEITANIAKLYSTDTHLKINAYVHDDAKDISTEILTSTTESSVTGAVFAKPSSNTVLLLDDSIDDPLSGSKQGLIVNVVSKTI